MLLNVDGKIGNWKIVKEHQIDNVKRFRDFFYVRKRSKHYRKTRRETIIGKDIREKNCLIINGNNPIMYYANH